MFGWNQSFFPNVAWKATMVLGLFWILAILLRGRSAAVRHLVWTFAFVALLLLPVFSVWLPVWAVPVAAPILTPDVVFQTAASTPARTAAAPAHPDRYRAPIPLPAERRDWLLTLWAAGTGLSLMQMALNFLLVARTRRAARPFPGLDLTPWTRALGI